MVRSFLLVLLSTTVVTAGQSAKTLKVDPASSQVTILVGKGGAFGFAGHEHEVVAPAVGGAVSLDEGDLTRSSVTLEFDAAALKVTGKGEPAKDVPEVQRVMLSERVLDVKKFPKIVFKSRSIKVTKGANADSTLVIVGDLTLHGQTRPIEVPTRVTLAGGKVAAKGSFEIKQTAFGIVPVSAAGGTVRVKDAVTVTFSFNAR